MFISTLNELATLQNAIELHTRDYETAHVSYPCNMNSGQSAIDTMHDKAYQTANNDTEYWDAALDASESICQINNTQWS